jgi:hypothetical protein
MAPPAALTVAQTVVGTQPGLWSQLFPELLSEGEEWKEQWKVVKLGITLFIPILTNPPFEKDRAVAPTRRQPELWTERWPVLWPALWHGLRPELRPTHFHTCEKSFFSIVCFILVRV